MSSSSAVFLLVFNVTDENFEKRIVYWMHSIKALGHKPSVILVGTHLDDESVKKKELQVSILFHFRFYTFLCSIVLSSFSGKVPHLNCFPS